MASVDPRLGDLTVLLLAAKRCQARHQAPDWQTSIGLAALLETARSLPPREPVDLQHVDTSSGLAKMLLEARQRHGEGHDGPA